jgi:CheY-like chemotaxis protein
MQSRNKVPPYGGCSSFRTFRRIDLDPMTALLRQFGFEVVTASDGETGLKIASTQSPDVIISDAVMPDMSGAELCRRVRSHYKLKTYSDSSGERPSRR